MILLALAVLSIFWFPPMAHWASGKEDHWTNIFCLFFTFTADSWWLKPSREIVKGSSYREFELTKVKLERKWPEGKKTFTLIYWGFELPGVNYIPLWMTSKHTRKMLPKYILVIVGGQTRTVPQVFVFLTPKSCCCTHTTTQGKWTRLCRVKWINFISLINAMRSTEITIT